MLIQFFYTLRAAKLKVTVGGNVASIADRRALNQEIRQWARDKGMDVSDFGRISHEVLIAYYKAHPSKQPIA